MQIAEIEQNTMYSKFGDSLSVYKKKIESELCKDY